MIRSDRSEGQSKEKSDRSEGPSKEKSERSQGQSKEKSQGLATVVTTILTASVAT
jgi:hypothetical protein